MNAPKTKKLPAQKAPVSIAEARSQLPALVHRAEMTGPIVLSRRGRPVAVLLSLADYEQLGKGPGFMERMERLRAEYRDVLETEDISLVFEQARDRSPGRELDLYR